MDAADPALVEAWLTARSISRGLPWPVADHGGLRVDSNQLEEHRRYIFVEPGEGLRQLGAEVAEPYVHVKLCRPAAQLMGLLPDRWRLLSDHFMLVWDAPPAAVPVAAGYTLALDQEGAVTVATISDSDGVL